jgi:hypothetical protein
MSRLLFSLILIICLCTLSCKESLPLRNDPVEPIIATLKAEYISPGQMDIEIHVKNVYDETFYGNGDYSGTIEISWAGHPEMSKNDVLTKIHMVRGPNYEPGTGKILFDPGSDIYYLYRWNFTLDSGDTLYKKFSLTHDASCAAWVDTVMGSGFKKVRKRWIWYPRDFSDQKVIIRSRIKLLRELAASDTGPVEYAFQYETYPKYACKRVPNPP